MTDPSSIQRVMRDLLDLAELQMQLLAVDSEAAKRKLTGAVGASLVAVTLGGSALTVLIAGLGVWVHEVSELSVGVSLMLVAVAVFLVVAVLLWVALRAIHSAAASMKEVRSEFAENLRWLKATLVSPGTSARNRLRRESFDPVDDPDVNRFAGDRRGRNAPTDPDAAAAEAAFVASRGGTSNATPPSQSNRGQF